MPEPILVVYRDGREVVIEGVLFYGVLGRNTDLFYYSLKPNANPDGFIPIEAVMFFGPKKDFKYSHKKNEKEKEI